MAEEISSPLLSLIREQGLIDDLQYEEVAGENKRAGTPVFQVLQDFGIMDLDAILHVIANYLGSEVVSLGDVEFTPALLKSIPGSSVRMYRCVPVEVAPVGLRVAFEEPLNPARIDELSFIVKKDIQPVVANPADISKLIEKYYGQNTGDNVSEILKQLGEDQDIAKEVQMVEEKDDAAIMAELADAAPIVRFVNLVILQAVQDRASDIHFEPFETEFRIRYRVDGALYEMSPPPKHLALPVVSRIKVMANLNISERRLPQDGRISIPLGSRQVDLRVSTLPTAFGESVVLRVLDRSAVSLDLETLGLPKYAYDYISDAIMRPNGIFVVTGPTGSGKTTTLYSCLRRVNTIDSKLLTAEDPVEFDIEGIMQVAINEALGMTFSKALRSFLRQDPDIIMVGEMRDIETAQISIQASLTGHLVLSTLHTIDAGQTINRILGMFQTEEQEQIRARLADTLRWVVSQRLVPRVGGGRFPLLEIMGSNLRTQETVRLGESEGKSFYEIIEASQAFGWRNFDNSALEAFEQGHISEESALLYCTKRGSVTRGIDNIKKGRGESTTPIGYLRMQPVQGRKSSEASEPIKLTLK